jgi:hypothetical protein
MLIFTGLMISEAVLPALGITIVFDPAWIMVHKLTANLSVFIIGLHVALHWQWIMKTVKRTVFAPFRRHTVEMPSTVKEVKA